MKVVMFVKKNRENGCTNKKYTAQSVTKFG